MKIQAPITPTKPLKLIVMTLGRLTLACRIETVYKVVNRAQVHSSGQGYTGLTNIEGRTVVVVDLHHKLFNTSIADAQGYFVIIKPQRDQLLAIPVATSPNLLDVNPEHIRVLPAAYRQSDTLAISSHVAVVPQGDKTLTIFIIDEKALI